MEKLKNSEMCPSPSQIPHGLILEWTWASAVTNQQLTTCAVAWLSCNPRFYASECFTLLLAATAELSFVCQNILCCHVKAVHNAIIKYEILLLGEPCLTMKFSICFVLQQL
jgi:hypothetical protein